MTQTAGAASEANRAVTDDAFVAEAMRDLERAVGGPARFRPGQLEAIRSLVEERRRVLVVQRTGWGKSAVYFVATAMLRRRGAGPTIIVSPLLGLMRNQIAAAGRGTVRAATINSANQADWEPIEAQLERDEIDVLLISPERFANDRFRDTVLSTVARRSGLFVVDEVHCISDWGHDFRPDYRRVSGILRMLPPGVPVLGTTATANDRVVADVSTQLGDGLLVLRGPLDRESLALDVVPLPSPADRLAWLASTIPTLDGSGIVYTLTVEDARRVAAWLQLRGIAAQPYFGDLETEVKEETERAFLRDECKVIVATSALGMGYDKPNVAFVIHFQSPGSPIAYYQQVGRAGRAIERAHGVMLVGYEDTDIQDYFIETAFPRRDQAEDVVRVLEERGDFVRAAELEQLVNIRHNRLITMCKMLEVEGALEKGDGYSWRRTATPWSYDGGRYEAVTAERRREQQAMRDYIREPGCLMTFLRHQLDDPVTEPCGRCVRCTGVSVGVAPDDEMVARARAFLRSRSVNIEPRKQGVPVAERAEVGRALALYGDGEWGAAVMADRAAGHYRDELVAALSGLVREWSPEPEPEWVTYVPSLRSPELVPSLAERLARELGLPFRAVVRKTRETALQAEMRNGPKQQANVGGAFEVDAEPLPGPVLLVDDLVDSRWTLTEVAGLLRRVGGGAAYPVVLASAYGS